MGFERNYLFGKVDIDLTSTGSGVFTLQTDIPGRALAQTFSFTIPSGTRRPVSSRLPGTMQGHYVTGRYVPAAGGQTELYGVRVWARELPTGQWAWYVLPVVDTPLEYQAINLPVEPTGTSYSKMSLPVEPTEESFQKLSLPVEPTGETFSKMALPVEPTSETFSPISIPVEPTGESYSKMALPVEPTEESFQKLSLPVEPTGETFRALTVPIEPTGESYSQIKLPVKSTPPVPEWVSLGIDE